MGWKLPLDWSVGGGGPSEGRISSARGSSSGLPSGSSHLGSAVLAVPQKCAMAPKLPQLVLLTKSDRFCKIQLKLHSSGRPHVRSSMPERRGHSRGTG